MCVYFFLTKSFFLIIFQILPRSSKYSIVFKQKTPRFTIGGPKKMFILWWTHVVRGADITNANQQPQASDDLRGCHSELKISKKVQFLEKNQHYLPQKLEIFFSKNVDSKSN